MNRSGVGIGEVPAYDGALCGLGRTFINSETG
jgi:hypothetical protein